MGQPSRRSRRIRHKTKQKIPKQKIWNKPRKVIKLELIKEFYSEEYGHPKKEPNTPEDKKYQEKLLKLIENYPITKITLTLDNE